MNFNGFVEMELGWGSTHCRYRHVVIVKTRNRQSYLNLFSAVPCQCSRRICRWADGGRPTRTRSPLKGRSRRRDRATGRGRARALNYVIWAIRELLKGEVSASIEFRGIGAIPENLARNSNEKWLSSMRCESCQSQKEINLYALVLVYHIQVAFAYLVWKHCRCSCINQDELTKTSRNQWSYLSATSLSAKV